MSPFKHRRARLALSAMAVFAALQLAFFASNTIAAMLPREALALAAESAASPLIASAYDYGQRVGPGAVAFDNNRFILEVACQKDMGNPVATWVAADIIDADKAAGDVELQYFRYWHGWQLLGDICLLAGGIGAMQIPVALLSACSAALLFLALSRRLGRRDAAVFCAVLLLSSNIALNFAGDLLLCLSFSTMLLMLAAGMLAHGSSKIGDAGLALVALAGGCIYQFLDFLTIPATAAALWAFAGIVAGKGRGAKPALKLGCALLAAFAAGYAATWACKWTIAAAVLGPEYVIGNVVGEMGVWSHGSASLPQADWPGALQAFYNASPRAFAVCATAGYALASNFVALAAFIAIAAWAAAFAVSAANRRFPKGHAALREFALIAAPALVVLAYFLAMPTHAIVHIPVFGCKNWALPFALCLLAMSRAWTMRKPAAAEDGA